jgi:hypothetical protein
MIPTLRIDVLMQFIPGDLWHVTGDKHFWFHVILLVK